MKFLGIFLCSVIFVGGFTENKKYNLLVIGNGAREHSIVWKLSLSDLVENIYVAPGSDAIAREEKVSTIDIQSTDIDSLVSFVNEKKIDFTIVGPEKPLELGIADVFSKEGLACLAPSASCALLETSKAFSKDFMKRHSIPHAKSETFTDYEEAVTYIAGHKMPIVIKPDGLASGKGVVIANNVEEANKACYQMLIEQKFALAGKKIVIEEYLEGEEVSFIVLTDGKTVIPMKPTQDHKARNNSDTGPNTGGMGAYSPLSIMNAQACQRILTNIVWPTITGISKEKEPYRGFLYVGLMMTKEGPKVLEYNCRLGDPEAQVILMRMQSDFAQVCKAAVEAQLDTIDISWDPRHCICVVLASEEYPKPCKEKLPIYGLSLEKDLNYKIFHSHTFIKEDQFFTDGGRVLCICSLGDDLLQAKDHVYKRIEDISWEGMHYRTDIGFKELRR